MKPFSRNKILIVLFLVLLASTTQICAHKLARRQSGESNDVSLIDLANSLGKVPVIGIYLQRFVEGANKFFMSINFMTNGILARFLGGMLPCEVSKEHRIVCSGISEKGGVFGFVENFITNLPNPPVSDTFKTVILMFIKMVVNPLVDTLFGGVPSASGRSMLGSY